MVSLPVIAARSAWNRRTTLFLVVLSGLAYFTKKKVWKDVHA